MPFCLPSLRNLLNSKTQANQRKPTHPDSTTIELRVASHSSPKQWNFAKMSLETTSDDNIISQRLLEEVLGEHDAQSWIEVEWYLQRWPRKVYSTRFSISSTYDPPFDTVLGRRDISNYGIRKMKHAG
ncbi:hypothetical protein K469DRAFT_716860 [Zopfia rhizophila CBS 207.26]|uniref:Uncharacterized protein n=1 Tax=Zopfia rhizophila CBS 207.26 TaxID=1314779 RepID=A0A6A6EL71_9PEZI|nr:hypothetical protein K469DRAFT_716860 [Zopfia rhizophila CBS 207.26]